MARLSKGSLVLVRENNDTLRKSSDETEDTKYRWRYARVAGNAEGSLLLLYLNPEESLVVSVEADKAIPVSPEMCSKFFLNGDVQSVSETPCSITNSI